MWASSDIITSNYIWNTRDGLTTKWMPSFTCYGERRNFQIKWSTLISLSDTDASEIPLLEENTLETSRENRKKWKHKKLKTFGVDSPSKPEIIFEDWVKEEMDTLMFGTLCQDIEELIQVNQSVWSLSGAQEDKHQSQFKTAFSASWINSEAAFIIPHSSHLKFSILSFY